MTEDFDPLALSEYQRRVLAEAPVMAGMAIYAVSHPGPWGAVRELRAASTANHLIRNPGERDEATELIEMLCREVRSTSVSRELQDRLDVDDANLPAVAMAALEETAVVIGGALPSPVREQYVAWILDVAHDVAAATADRGEKVPVSAEEYRMLARIENVLSGSL